MNELIEIIKIKAKKEFDIEENLIENHIIDSIDFIYIISEIENRFNVNIDFLEIEPSKITTVKGLWELIDELG
jgi:acyl carrier protein